MGQKINIIQSKNAPKAIGPYSHAIKINGFIFCSGQIAIDPKTGNLIGKTTKIQTKQVLKNIKAVLKSAGSSVDKVVKTTVFLKNMKDFQEFNEVYELFFKPHKPARSTIEVSNLPKGALIEIEVIACM